MRRPRKPIIVALAATLMLATAVQALAAPKRFEAPAEGGEARLILNKVGYTLKGCDTDADGYGVVAYVYTKGRRDAAFEAKDTDGADSGCEETRIKEPLGRDVVLRVVVKDHNNSEGHGENHLKADHHILVGLD